MNVFDIQEGVSINIFVKTGGKAKDELAKVYHYDCYGKRQNKYEFLAQNNLASIDFTPIPPKVPHYYWVQKGGALETEYQQGFQVNKLFPVNSVGIVTARDHFVINAHKDKLQERMIEFFTPYFSDEEIANKYELKNTTSFKIDRVRKFNIFESSYLKKITYRPFDSQYIYYDKSLVDRRRYNIMQHFLLGENVGLTVCRQFKGSDAFYHSFITKHIFESSLVSNKTSEIGSGFPLYLYPIDGELNDGRERRPNLDMKIVEKIAQSLGLSFTEEKQENQTTFAPIDILDYIYAILHSPHYREKYKEFLKTDFPYIPYPNEPKIFWQLVSLGGEIRKLHLLESPALEQNTPLFKGKGDLIVEKPEYKEGHIYINKEQYFEDIPSQVWHFYIGGYQPAQKWLKDRKGENLSFDDITHYIKILTAQRETIRLMNEIDMVMEI